MFRNRYSVAGTFGAIALAAFLLFANAAWAAVSPTDRAVETALQDELGKKFAAVRVQVEDRIATLTGSVDSYLEKLSAEKKAHKYAALRSVVNRIQVAGPTVADRQLAEKLSRKLVYDRTFQGNLFDAFSLNVKNGVVTLGGYAHSYPSRDSALGMAAAEKGVKGVVDKIEVLPLSPLDDRIRIVAVRRLYGTSSLQKYALDPAHPIRIIVRNGNVMLEGSVLNPMDRTIAGLALTGITGVFSVTNNLQVPRDRESD